MRHYTRAAAPHQIPSPATADRHPVAAESNAVGKKKEPSAASRNSATTKTQAARYNLLLVICLMPGSIGYLGQLLI